MCKVKAFLVGCLKSWTIHFNLWFSLFVYNLPDMITNFQSLQGHIPDNLYKYAFAFLMVANFVLRIKTNASLINKGTTQNDNDPKV